MPIRWHIDDRSPLAKLGSTPASPRAMARAGYRAPRRAT
jgi:hypothetical protein